MGVTYVNVAVCRSRSASESHPAKPKRPTISVARSGFWDIATVCFCGSFTRTAGLLPRCNSKQKNRSGISSIRKTANTPSGPGGLLDRSIPTDRSSFGQEASSAKPVSSLPCRAGRFQPRYLWRSGPRQLRSCAGFLDSGVQGKERRSTQACGGSEHPSPEDRARLLHHVVQRSPSAYFGGLRIRRRFGWLG